MFFRGFPELCRQNGWSLTPSTVGGIPHPGPMASRVTLRDMDRPERNDWWQASDGKWYPPESRLPPPPHPPPPQRRVHKVGASLGATVGIGFAAFFVVGIVGLSCMYPGPGWWCDWGAAVVALTVLGLALAGIAWTNWRIWRKR